MYQQSTAPRRVKLSQAALQYGVTVPQLRRAIAAGELTQFRLGPRIITVDLDELDQLYSRRITLVDAATRYGISTKTLRRAIAAGKLTRHLRGERLITVDVDELEALFEQGASA